MPCKRIRLSTRGDEDLENKIDKLIITDSLAAGFEYEFAEMVHLKKREGFGELLEMLKNNQFDLKKYKLVIFMLGRADIWDDEVLFRVTVQALT